MYLTAGQTLVTVLAVALGAMVTRFVPFLLFPEDREPPRVVLYLGKLLPPAMMGLLVVYCLRNVSLAAAPHALPEAIALLVLTALHLWRRNTLLSIAGGTLTYMLLVQLVF